MGTMGRKTIYGVCFARTVNAEFWLLSSNFFVDVEKKIFFFLGIWCCFRWIYTLDSNKLEKKYKKLSEIKGLKGASCKLVGNEQFEDIVDMMLEKCGLKDEEDRIYVMKEMKQLSLPNPLAIWIETFECAKNSRYFWT